MGWIINCDGVTVVSFMGTMTPTSLLKGEAFGMILVSHWLPKSTSSPCYQLAIRAACTERGFGQGFLWRSTYPGKWRVVGGSLAALCASTPWWHRCLDFNKNGSRNWYNKRLAINSRQLAWRSNHTDVAAARQCEIMKKKEQQYGRHFEWRIL